jgi:amino acid adenylation domain-containing protein/non-ribosomal peptide synthase protein (TIGR01720 family)
MTTWRPGEIPTPPEDHAVGVVPGLRDPAAASAAVRADAAVFPCSSAQRRLFFLDRFEPGSALYNVPFAARIEGALDTGALEKSLAALVRRHEALRTTFAMEEGEPVQIIAPDGTPALARVDLAAPAVDDAPERVLDLACAEAAKPFDLQVGPLWRVLLVQLAPRDHLLVLTLHHIVSDAWSQRLILDEIARHYAAFQGRSAPTLPPSPLQYADFAAWQRRVLDSGSHHRAEEFWERHLAGSPALLSLPVDRPRPAVASGRGGTQAIAIPPAILGKLEALCRGERASLFMGLLAAFQALLFRWSGEEDLVVGTAVAGRGRPELEGVVGCFINTLALRATVSGAASFLELLARARAACLEAFEHQDLPFERLVERLRPERRLDHTPLFQVMLVLDTAAGPPLTLAECRVRPVPLGTGTAKHDLTLALERTEEGLRGVLEYAIDLFEAGTIARLAREFEGLLAAAADHPGTPIAALPGLTPPAELRPAGWRPRVAGGATDRDAQPAPDALPPSNALPVPGIERTLVRLWCELLRLERVGPHDNFFALGGDSILSLQLVARAQQEGIAITPRQIFEHQTIAALAAAAAAAAPGGAPAEQGPVTGEVPLTPIQAWFLEQDFAEAHHWNQGFSLDLREPIPKEILREAVRHLHDHHDALRLRFERGPRGWSQRHAEPGPPPEPVFHDLSRLTEGEQNDAMAAEAARLQAGFDLARGSLFGIARFDLGPERPGRLLIGAHHLIVDGVSWRILLEDLESACRQIARTGTVRLPPKTTAFREWARRLADFVREGGCDDERAYWLGEAARPSVRLPFDGPGGANLEASARTVLLTLPPEETRALLHETTRACRARLDEILLAALTRAIARWTGGGAVRIDVEGHGREDLFDSVDLSRTTGWFTSVFPVVLPLVGERNAAVRAIKERLRRVPRRGFGYGLLRHAGPATTAARLRDAPQAEIAFNDYGRIEPVSGSALFGFAGHDPGPLRAPRARRSHPIELDVVVLGDRLRLRVTFSEDLHRRATLERLAGRWLEEIRAIVANAEDAGRTAAIPADFPLADLQPGELDRLIAAHPGLESVYPLTPMQHGMLVHTLRSPAGGEYVEQLVCTLRGRLDPEAFERAWRHVFDRHEALRVAIHWDRPGRPLQIVHRDLRPPFIVHDWSDADDGERAARLETLLRDDRARGFDPASAPLLRLFLCRVAPDDHRLVFTHHHLILDGWSLAILLREVFAAYDALCDGAPPRLEPVARFEDYVAWLQKQDASAAKAYWRAALTGFVPPTPFAPQGRDPRGDSSLPADASFPATGRDEREVFLDEAATRALEQFARRRQVTLNTLVLGAWALLLARRSGTGDVVFGASVAGRPPALPGIARLVGLCINTLPVRVRVDPEAALSDWLAGFQSELASMRQYEHASLADIGGWSAVPPGRPLFDSIVVFENYPVGAPLRLRHRAPAVDEMRSIEWTNYPITVGVAPGARLALALSWDRTRFSEPDALALLEEYRGLLETMASDRGSHCGALLGVAAGAMPAPAGERRPRPVPRSTARPEDRTALHERIAAVAACAPRADAVRCECRIVSFGELTSRSDRLARALAQAGVGPERIVGVHLRRSADVPLAVLAILKAGGAYAPLDPEWPPERVRHVLAKSRPQAVLTERALRASLPAPGGMTVLLVDAAGEPHGPDAGVDAPPPDVTEAPLSLPVDPDSLAYVIQTSGSSGAPKGVQVTHRALLSRATALAERYALRPDDRVLQFAALSFDVSAEELFPTWLAGACVVPRTDATPLVIPDFLSWISREGVTVLNLPASYWHAIVDALDPDHRAGGPALRLPACVRLVVVGSEPVDADRWERWRARVGGVRLLNAYGPTEATITATLFEPEAGSTAPRGSTVPIGRPIRGVEAWLLDGDLRPVAPGTAGDLYLGGDGLARGYLGRPDLTAARFVPHPCGPRPGARLYATGDRARERPDGVLDYLGRSDSQVKIRGFRIEPGEIEAVLRAHPSVSDAAVVIGSAATRERRIEAWAVARHDGVDAGALRAHLSAQLPEYMVPARITMIEALPRTPGGKIDRRELASTAPDALAAPPEPPRDDDGAGGDPVPEIISGIWSDILGVPRVAPEADFFALGGHSLLATQVVSRLRDAFGVEVPMRDLFDHPTLGALAVRVRQLRLEARDLETAGPIVAGPRPDEIPLSFAQERQWFLDRLVPDRPIYNVHVPLRAKGRLDVRALRRALQALVRRHEVLRTVFETIDGRPVQIIRPRATQRMPVVDLRPLPPEAREAEALRLSTAEARDPFDLRLGPLLRTRLLRLAADDHVLLITMHHIVSDGWSAGVSAREIAALYAAARSGALPALPDPPIQYADFALWQRGWLRGETLERQLAYWRSQLTGAPRLAKLPVDRPRPAAQTFEGATETFALAASLTGRLETLSRRSGCTLFMTLLAGFQTLLLRYTGEHDLLVGSPIAGRSRTETEGLIGFFVNTLVLRVNLSGDPAFLELLRRVRAVCLEAYTHQDLPFEKLVEDLAPERALSHTPLIQVMFQLQTAASGSLELEDLSLTPLDVDTGTTQFDLSVDLLERAGGLEVQVEYSTDLFDAATIRRLMASYASLLEAAAADPERRLSELPIQSGSEVLGAIEAGAAPPGPGHDSEAAITSLHGLFEARAGLRPADVAFDADGDTVTYAELDGRAGRLAARLRRWGVGPEVRVAVHLPRSALLAASLLAILKAGGVYVPLDPDWPPARLAYLIADAAPVLVVTTASLRDRLPADVMVFDPEAELSCSEHAGPRGEDPDGARWPADPESGAYIIYTSGSTGRPKGVIVPHRAAVHHARAIGRAYGLDPGDRVLQFASVAFDVAIEELLGSWAHGAAVVVASSAAPPSPADLHEIVARERLTVLNLPSSYWHEWVDEIGSERITVPSCLRLVVVGSEPIDPERFEQWRRFVPAEVRWIGAYGTTEAAVTSLLDEPLAEPGFDARAALSLGRPLAGVETHVLDRRLEPVPAGATGDLFLGGAGLSRGYAGRPDLTAERFVPHPWTRTPGARLFRTGDRARRRADGRIDFLGRADRQVKVRGHRIELGEIEAALREHPVVSDAAVAVRSDPAGTPRLVAYVVPESSPAEAGPIAGDGALQAERIDDWRLVHDDELFNRSALGSDTTFDISGWNGSDTGAPIPPDEMRAWVDGTVQRVRALEPRRVFEIGCGTGLLLFRLAPHCAEYVGTDFSAAALDHVRRTLQAIGGPSHVSLLERQAVDFTGLEERSFDLVLLNSVAQYFPGADYLLRVVEGALSRLRPGGALFLGDLRSLPLLRTFHAWVLLRRAADTLPLAQVDPLLKKSLGQEEELLIAPRFFAGLRRRFPAITRVDVHLRRGRATNEMNGFRYDAIIRLGTVEDAARLAPPALDWDAGRMTLASLRDRLAAEAPDRLHIRRVPNARIAGAVRALAILDGSRRPRTMGELREACARPGPGAAVDPEDLWGLSEALPYDVDLCWSDSGSDGRFDALFRRAGCSGPSLLESTFETGDDPTADTNDPLRGKIERHRVRALRGHLEGRLPASMVPSAFVMLDALPRAANGKIDREVLPPPDEPTGAEGESTLPRDALELRLVRLYEEVLDVRPVGVTDSFFVLGGHSLLAVRLVALVQKRLGCDVPLAAVFQEPTPERLAALIRKHPGAAPCSTAVPLQPRGSAPPLFCVHPAGGGVLHYLDLARHLGEERPFYALHAPGLYGEREPSATLEASAEACLAAIRAVRPAGPYALGGWSFGGLVAFEVAQRLVAAGEEVAFLALLDTVAPEPAEAAGREDEEEDDASLIAWYAEDFARFFGRDLPAARLPRLLSAEDLRPRGFEEMLRYLHEVAAAVGGLPPDAGLDRIRRYIEVYRSNHRAAARYRPSAVYPGPVTLFRAAGDAGADAADTALGWRAWISGSLRVQDVPGTHETFIAEPHVPALARRLRLCLDQTPELS